MRISFTGPGCSGKTTLLNKCREHYGDRFDYIEEVTRPALKKGLKINEGGDNETQLFILEEHLKNDKLANVIMDRCIVDGFVYTTWLHLENKVDESVLNQYEKIYLELLDNIDILFYTKPVPLVDDGVRSVDEMFTSGIQNVFELVIQLAKVGNTKIVTLEGDVDTRFNDIKIAIEQYDQ